MSDGNGNGHSDPSDLALKEAQKNFKQAKRAPKDWPVHFLKALSKWANVVSACRIARVRRETAYERRQLHPDFAAQWDAALQQGIARIEDALTKLATVGQSKPIWMKNAKGRPVKVETVREVNVTAAIFMLKAHDPNRYRERTSTELTGAGGGPVEFRIDPTVATALERAYGRSLTPAETEPPKGNGNGSAG